jgi:hypothetical protein
MLACCFSISLLVALAPKRARADEPNPHPGVGGHVGIATGLVTVSSDDATTISDQFTLSYPIGIGFKLGEKTAIDFETVVHVPISPKGATSLTVDPGIVHDMGSFVLGLRLAWDIQANTNFGLIPLIHKGVAQLGGGANWFVEAAFPIALSSGVTGNPPEDKTTFSLTVVLHTGIAF